jgi:hypothetical protein
LDQLWSGKTCRCLDEDQPDSHPGPIVAVKGQYMPIKDILLPRLHEFVWRGVTKTVMGGGRAGL